MLYLKKKKYSAKVAASRVCRGPSVHRSIPVRPGRTEARLCFAWTVNRENQVAYSTGYSDLRCYRVVANSHADQFH